jgi:multidrug efflux pump subunit AcrB
MIKLNDIAIIKDGFEETPLRTRFKGVSAVEVEIFCTGDESIIEVTQAVKDFILEQQTRLPQGLSMDYWRDGSEPIRGRLQTLSTSAWQGAF